MASKPLDLDLTACSNNSVVLLTLLSLHMLTAFATPALPDFMPVSLTQAEPVRKLSFMLVSPFDSFICLASLCFAGVLSSVLCGRRRCQTT